MKLSTFDIQFHSMENGDSVDMRSLWFFDDIAYHGDDDIMKKKNVLNIDNGCSNENLNCIGAINRQDESEQQKKYYDLI